MKVESEVKSLSRARLSATPWTAARQAPPPLGFSRPEHWGGRHRRSTARNRALVEMLLVEKVAEVLTVEGRLQMKKDDRHSKK